MFIGVSPGRKSVIKRMKALVIPVAVIIIMLICSGKLMAGAWVQPPGKCFVSLQSYYYETNEYFDSGGSRKSRGGTFEKFEFNPYVECGLTTKDTLVLNIFYDWLRDNVSGTTKKTNGFADIEAGWRRLLLKRDPHVFSAQLLGIFPADYDIEDDPRLGYGRYGMEASVLYGRYFKLSGRYGFFDSQLGFRSYFGYPSEQIRTNLTLGYDLFKRIQVLCSSELHYGLDNGAEKTVGRNITVEPQYRLLKITGALRFRITADYSVVGAAYCHAWGENTGADGGFYGSLWLRF